MAYATTIRNVKEGQFFTLVQPNQEDEVKQSQVYIRQHYDRGSKTFSACRFDDICKERFFKADKKVYVDFIF